VNIRRSRHPVTDEVDESLLGTGVRIWFVDAYRGNDAVQQNGSSAVHARRSATPLLLTISSSSCCGSKQIVDPAAFWVVM
jgi:hypothetical protein